MTPPFSAWKVGLVFYGPLLVIGAALLIMALRGHKWAWAGALPLLFCGLFALFFFRDPARDIAAKGLEMVSPADGKVVAIEDLEETPYYEGPCRRVSIFLSLFNVHVNRAPFAGKVTKVAYKPGEFRPAMDAATSECNEANAVWLETEHGPLTVRQISGIIARRIVCVTQEGNALETGQKFGMIRFGSRTELYMPPDAEVRVTVGDRVKAGSTIMAAFS